MRKARIFLLVLASLVMLSACGAKSNPQPAEPPAITSTVDIGSARLEQDVTSLNLDNLSYDLDMLIAAGDVLDQLVSIDLGVTDLRGDSVERLSAAYPNAEITYIIRWMGQNMNPETKSIDLSGMTPNQTEELLNVLPMLPQLEKINFVDENGVCAFGLEDMDELDRIREAYPDLYLQVNFDLFGQTVTSEDERIEYFRVEIGNEGAETIRRVLPYLRSCTYFLVDGCGIDNEIMAQMREDFPETKIVWRIWLIEEDYSHQFYLRGGSLMSDTHRVRTTNATDKNSHLLNYCIEAKYLDVGHVWGLTQCDFLAYMPDLEACIIAITRITDISPLANHDKLEYLELFSTDIADISALASCPNLEHLNLSNMPLLDDISPVYTLKNLKRLRMVDSPLITEEEMQQAAEALPNCKMLNHGHFPTAGQWRWLDPNKVNKDPRYELLCEQMEYTLDSSCGIP